MGRPAPHAAHAGGCPLIAAVAAHRAEIAALCRRFHVARLDLFGSAARGTDFEPDRSDLDFLVEYQPGYAPSLDEYMDLRDALTVLGGRKVDLVMASSLRNPFLRAAIERSREVIYGP
jgi:predicted nucleotidyltransferase